MRRGAAALRCVYSPADVHAAAGRHVLDALRPHSVEQGGPLVVRHVSYVEGRGNILVEYPGTDADAGVTSLVGMARARHGVRIRVCHLTRPGRSTLTWCPPTRPPGRSTRTS